ncbi:MAG: aspartyl/glutamyl-tRNA amidotransferase subunit C [Candidatus Adiutrix sp.]|nr:aspartyl/glutamyl-tRNA amidotransferase subunit C [Candidatus Adiutrix sp.]
MDQKTVERTAALAQLEIYPDPAAAARLAEEMAGLVKSLGILSEADVSGTEPLYWPVLDELAGPRPDEPGPGAEPEALLEQAPDRVGRFFAVPKII